MLFYLLGGGWAVSLIWAMMILPLADALQNCFQNLTSRIAGIDNEQMTNRVVGMGAMLGFGLGAIKEQFNSPSSNNNNTGNNGNGGLRGFIDRAKSVVNPSMNLSPEKDYNGNVNPIRTVLPKENNNVNNNISIPTQNGKNTSNMSNGTSTSPKSIAGKVAKTGFNATKAYLSMGAKMAEGDFSKSPYQNSNKQINRKSNYQNVEYMQNIQKLANENNAKKLGDQNEPKE